MSKKRLHFFLSIVLILVVWEIIAFSVGNNNVFPHIFSVLKAIIRLLSTPSFYSSLLFTSVKGLLAFILAYTFSLFLLYLSFYFPMLKIYIKTLSGVVKSLPVAAISILFLVWVDSSSLPFYVAFVMSFPTVLEIVNVAPDSKCLTSVESATVLGINNNRIFFEIYLYDIRYLLLGALSSALPLSFKSAIASEVIGLVKNSLGYIMYESKLFFEIDRLIAITVVVVVIVKIYEMLLTVVLKKLCYIKKK